MNNQRRKEIELVADAIRTNLLRLEELIDEEREYFESIPENLQETERAQRSEELADIMEEAKSEIEDKLDELTEEIYQ